MSAEAILSNAAEYLSSPARWHQGGYSSTDRAARCAIGAICDASVKESAIAYNDAVKALQEVLGEHYPERVLVTVAGYKWVDIPAWNDAGDRTHSEVIEMFQKATALAGEKGL